MQIAKIVLYKDQEHKRVLEFRLGKVNIITGDSKTGKSALIDIVDYCLASKECHVATGVIRDNVYWFSVVVVFGNDYYFIARQNPDRKQVSSVTEMYLAKVDKDTIPAYEEIIPNANVDSIRLFLARMIGLPENIQLVEDGGTREPLTVSFMHSRQFCYQPQSLIANKDLLFYHTLDSFAKQALKDAFPFLCGAVSEDVLVIERQLKELNRRLRVIRRKQGEHETVLDEQGSLADALIEEARVIGLTTQSAANVSHPIALLEKITQWTPDTKIVSSVNVDTALQELVKQRQELIVQLGNIQEKLSIAKNYLSERQLLQKELDVQQQRLKSIELIPHTDECQCPLCHQPLSEDVPKVNEIYALYQRISANLSESREQTLRTQEFVAELLGQESDIKIQISHIEDSISDLYAQKEEIRQRRDLNVQRGKVIGRISLFLEKLQVKDDSRLEEEVNQIEEEIKKLKSKIDKDSKEDRLSAAIAIINAYMNGNWKQTLDLEDVEAIISFDPKRLQVYIASDNNYVPLCDKGSGANWVGYHLLLHFALHKFFIKHNCPIPRFLFLDQPSQIYFPSDRSDLNGIPSQDMDAVERMFSFIFDRTREMDGDFQVILTEHANINKPVFQGNVLEVWLNGQKLIPEEWYTNEITD